MQSLFNYTDYRNFLRDYAKMQRASSTKWSYGRWAQKLDLANTAVITNIVNGQRHPGPKVLDKLTEYFNFKKEENDYFRNLVLFSKNKHRPELSQLIIKCLENSHPQKKFLLVEEANFQVIAKPYYYAIREMVNLKNFKSNITWIQEKLRFKISKPEIKRTIENLLNLGLLAKDDQGKLSYHNGSIRSSTDIYSEALRQFHEEMITSAKQSIREVPIEKRNISGISFSIAEKDLPEIKAAIEKFQAYLMETYEKLGEGDEVYQLNTQLFPLTTNKIDKNTGDDNENHTVHTN